MALSIVIALALTITPETFTEDVIFSFTRSP